MFLIAMIFNANWIFIGKHFYRFYDFTLNIDNSVRFDSLQSECRKLEAEKLGKKPKDIEQFYCVR